MGIWVPATTTTRTANITLLSPHATRNTARPRLLHVVARAACALVAAATPQWHSGTGAKTKRRMAGGGRCTAHRAVSSFFSFHVGVLARSLRVALAPNPMCESRARLLDEAPRGNGGRVQAATGEAERGKIRRSSTHCLFDSVYPGRMQEMCID